MCVFSCSDERDIKMISGKIAILSGTGQSTSNRKLLVILQWHSGIDSKSYNIPTAGPVQTLLQDMTMVSVSRISCLCFCNFYQTKRTAFNCQIWKRKLFSNSSLFLLSRFEKEQKISCWPLHSVCVLIFSWQYFGTWKHVLFPHSLPSVRSGFSRWFHVIPAGIGSVSFLCCYFCEAKKPVSCRCFLFGFWLANVFVRKKPKALCSRSRSIPGQTSWWPTLPHHNKILLSKAEFGCVGLGLKRLFFGQRT